MVQATYLLQPAFKYLTERVMVTATCLLTVGMVVIPYENKTFEFVLHNGSVNLFLVLVEYYFARDEASSESYVEKTLETEFSQRVS